MLLTDNTTYWDTINCNSKSYPIINNEQNCDVLIVGGGIAGCITCYYLSLYNISTILIEKNTIGHIDNFSSACLFPETDELFSKLISIVGKEKALRATKLCQKALDELETILFSLHRSCDFHKTTSIHLAKDASIQKNLFEEYTLKKNSSLQVKLMDSTINKIPAIYSNDSAIIDPIKLCHALLKSAISKGAKIYEKSPVHSFSIVNGINNVAFNDGTIRCKKVIYAISSNSLDLNNKCSLNSNSSASIVTCIDDTLKSTNDICYLLDLNNGSVLTRTTEDNRILASLNSIDYFSIDSKEILVNSIKSLYPSIKNLKIEYQWVAKNIETNSKLPIIGKSKSSQDFYYNLPLGINKIIYSFIGATILKDLILYNDSQDSEVFSFLF